MSDELNCVYCRGRQQTIDALMAELEQAKWQLQMANHDLPYGYDGLCDDESREQVRELVKAIPDCAPEHKGEMEALCMMEAEFKSVLAKHAEGEK